MPTYLFTWNPKRWEWTGLSDVAQSTADGTPWDTRWSTGRRTPIRKGDRAFLLRQGVEPRGIVGAGWARGPGRLIDHWDKNESGKTWMVPVRFDRVLDPDVDPVLLTADLAAGPLAGVHWGTQSSGLRVPDPAAALLEDLWDDHVGTVGREAAEVLADTDSESFPEGRLLFRMHRLRERNREVVAKAKAVALRKYGRLACWVCDFDFAVAYGKLGDGFIEAHHTRPLGELAGPSETRVADLALVCSNCHRMLHRRRPWLGMADLHSILTSRNG
jgi:5-methylcytosine-specific restriction protein A